MTLARRYEWSGTPLKAWQGHAAAHLQAAASAAELQNSMTRCLDSWRPVPRALKSLIFIDLGVFWDLEACSLEAVGLATWMRGA